MPLHLRTASEQPVAELHRPDEPLAAGDDLERAIPLLVELDGMRDRARIAEQIAALAKHLDDLHARLGRRQAGELIVLLLRADRVDRLPPGVAERHRLEGTVGLDHGANRQLKLTPPDDVGDVAEGADHRGAGALLGVRKRVRLDRHTDAEERRHHLGAEQRLIARIVRMRDDRDTRGNQLRPRGVDLDEATRPVRSRVRFLEPDLVVRARLLAILELRLRHRGSEVDVPQRRRFDLIGVPAVQQPQKCQLRDALRPSFDRRVGHAQSTESPGTATGARRPSRPRPSAGRRAR